MTYVIDFHTTVQTMTQRIATLGPDLGFSALLEAMASEACKMGNRVAYSHNILTTHTPTHTPTHPIANV